jgi:hypothetical protein
MVGKGLARRVLAGEGRHSTTRSRGRWSAGHFDATCEGFAATEGPILVLQDTIEFTSRPERIGLTYRVNSGRGKDGRFRMYTVCGLLMHSSVLRQQRQARDRYCRTAVPQHPGPAAH